jgi:hypothetical protein
MGEACGPHLRGGEVICPTCKREIPPMLLACEECVIAASYREALARAKLGLPRIVAGEVPLILTKPYEEERWHMRLYPHVIAWCGRALDPRWRKKTQRYPAIEFDTVCDGCVAAMAEEG